MDVSSAQIDLCYVESIDISFLYNVIYRSQYSFGTSTN